MTWGKPLGLDELMIINPSLPLSETYFLGDDGNIYQLQETEEDSQGIGEFFLGDDGTVYQLQNYQLQNLRRTSRKRKTCRYHRK